MIYFLVNNDYHMYMDMKLANQLSNHKLGLIQIPYSLNVIESSDLFSKIYHYPERLVASVKGILFNTAKFKSILKKVDNELNPGKNDILFVHTEMDLLNQHIIQKFYKVGAKIFLLEDGTGTMCYYNMKTGKVGFKDKFRSFSLKYLYDFKYLEIKKYGVETLPAMKDFVFNGIVVNYGETVLREIPLYKLKSNEEAINVSYENGAIFFSQAQYLWFTTEEEYIQYVESLLNISKNFSPFYFKFHPSDIEDVKEQIKQLIDKKYTNVIILNENDIAENIIIKYPVKYAITFNSTAALNLINRGIIPVFLNNMFNKLYPDDSFTVFGQFLKSIECYSPIELAEIKPGFCAFPNVKKKEINYSIIDIIYND